MKAGNYKDYADFCRQTDWMEPEDNSPSKDELFEEWLKNWEDEHGKANKEIEELLWEFFDKVVYRDYDYDGCNRVDWSLEEIKEYFLNWYVENYDKTIEQLGCLIRDVQKRGVEENEVLKKSRLLYTKLTGSCI